MKERENYFLGGEIYCFVQYCITAIQNSVLHTVSAYISHLSQMLHFFLKKRKFKAYNIGHVSCA